MLSWHNDPALKAEVVERMREHRRLDQIIQGTYQQWEGFAGHKGCFIGCTLPFISKAQRLLPEWNGWHYEVENRYGIPALLVSGMEQIFEGLTFGHGDFAVQVVEAIPVGIDLGLVQDKFRREYGYSARGLAWDARIFLLQLLAEATPKPEPVPPLIQHIDIPEPEPILIRTVVNN